MKVIVNGKEVIFNLEEAEEAISDLNEYKWNGLEEQVNMSKIEDDAKKARTGSYNTPVQFTKDQETYFEMMRKRLLYPKGKLLTNHDYGQSVGCCENPDKYENKITTNLQFYSCRNCGADLGNIV